ncbi:MAG: hypothetical protein AAF266_00720 [Planctomycetota bacterium]
MSQSAANEPSDALRRVPSEPLRRIDWLAVAPWVILFRCPAAVLGWPWLVGAVGAVLIGGFGVDSPTEFRYGWPDFREPIWPIPVTQVDWVGLARLAGWIALGLMIARSVARKLTGRPSVAIHNTVGEGLRSLPIVLAGGFGLLAPAALLLSLLTAVVGWLPGVTPSIVTTLVSLFALPLVAAVVIVGVSWPLLVGAIAVDRSDAFEAASRQLAYATQRPLRAAFYVGIAVVLGYVLSVPLELLLYVTQDWLSLATAGKEAEVMQTAPAGFDLAARVLRGFYPAYFFSAATAIYLLLRHDIDGQPLDEMAASGGQSPSVA